MPKNDSNVNTHTQDVVVFVTANAEAIWTGHEYDDLARFIDDMDALGFAVWVTPRVVYVFTGECE